MTGATEPGRRDEATRRPAPTIVDIAGRAGVSKSAVSRALRNEPDVSPATRKLVLDAADELGYVTNAMARGMRAGRTQMLGLVMRDVRRPFYSELYHSMQQRTEERGYELIAITRASELQMDDAKDAVRTLVSMRVDGIMVATAKLSAKELLPYAEHVPMVVTGRKEDHPDLTSISVDDRSAGGELADHVADLGHRRVAVVHVDAEYSQSQHIRGAAMIDRLRDRGVSVVAHPVPSDTAAVHVVDSVITDPTTTAMMCPTDAAMLDVLEILRLRGVDVPGRLSVSGFDAIGILGAVYLGFTSYRQPVRELGTTAVDLLTDAIASGDRGHSHTELRGRVVPGRTVGAPRV